MPLELPVQFWKPRLSRSSRRRHGRNLAASYAEATPRGHTGLGTDRNEDGTSEGGRKLDGWLSRLVWDPRTDEYERAVQKIVERRRQIFMSRGVSREACVSLSFLSIVKGRFSADPVASDPGLISRDCMTSVIAQRTL